MSNEKPQLTHHIKHMGVDLLAGIVIGVFYKPKTATGYAIKGAIAGLVVYHLLNDSSQSSSDASAKTHP